MPCIDKRFDEKEFIDGATKAIEIVTNRLARRNFIELEELITPETLDNLLRKISPMSDKERSGIAIDVADVSKAYIYRINVTLIKIHHGIP